MKKNPFAGYKEGKETAAQERREPKGLKAFEAKKGMDKPAKGKPPAMCAKPAAKRGR
jgi:hypothetical protein